jgi:hypothetical protein
MEKRALRYAGTNSPEVALMPELSPLEVHQAAAKVVSRVQMLQSSIAAKLMAGDDLKRLNVSVSSWHYPGSASSSDRPLRDMREYPLGFFQSGIGPRTGAIDVRSRPEIKFHGERLVVPSNQAEAFDLIDVKVANRSQLANSTSVPAEMFGETEECTYLGLDWAEIGQTIALVVENITSDHQTFQAALIGTAIVGDR